MAYISFTLTPKSRSQVLKNIGSVYSDVICHHITYKMTKETTPLPSQPKSIRVVGYVLGDKVEVAVVEINGSTRRSDGGTFHITISVDRNAGGKPVHSNNLLNNGWNNIDKPFDIDVYVEMIK